MNDSPRTLGLRRVPNRINVMSRVLRRLPRLRLLPVHHPVPDIVHLHHRRCPHVKLLQGTAIALLSGPRGNHCRVVGLTGVGYHQPSGAEVVAARQPPIVLITHVGRVVHGLVAPRMVVTRALRKVPSTLLRLPLPRLRHGPMAMRPPRQEGMHRATLWRLPVPVDPVCVVVREMRWALGDRRLRCAQHDSPCNAEL